MCLDRLSIAALAAAVFATAPLAAQERTPQQAAADSAFGACVAAAESNQGPQANAAADQAERLYAAWRQASPSDPIPVMRLGQIVTRCRIRFANFMRQAAMLEESNALLEEALSLDPRSWEARFALAMNHFHTPGFLGRAPDALRELETLLAQQGEAADSPRYALTYAFLGDLYLKGGDRARALELWRKGAALFPTDEMIQERLREQTPGK